MAKKVEKKATEENPNTVFFQTHERVEIVALKGAPFMIENKIYVVSGDIANNLVNKKFAKLKEK